MSRDDDFDDIMDSPDEMGAGQDDTSEPLLDEESLDESPDDDAEEIEIVTFTAESEDEGMPARARPQRSARKVPAKKKKAAIPPKPAARAKTPPKKKAGQIARKPAASRSAASKPAAKKTAAKKPAAKKPAAKKIVQKKKTAPQVAAKKKTLPAAKKKKAAAKGRRR